MLLIRLSCIDFMCKLSKDLIVVWSFSICFLYLLFFFRITSYITLLPNDNLRAVVVDIGIAIKPIPVRLNVIELDIVAIIIVSNDFNAVVNVLYFLFFFFELLFLSLEYVIVSLMLLM